MTKMNMGNQPQNGFNNNFNGMNGYPGQYPYYSAFPQGYQYYAPYQNYLFNQAQQNQNFGQQPNMSQGQNNGASQNNTVQHLVYVNGIEGAKAYLMRPNDRAFLMDSDNPMFYIKTSDANGQCSLRYFKFEEVDSAPTTSSFNESNFVSRAEFDKFKEEMLTSQHNKAKNDDTL